ncbi:MAG: C-terminal binding protein [Desulfobacterales bacterium]|nr:MAG: C-terminal binding protein [Desulfobacterales bacterium]
MSQILKVVITDYDYGDVDVERPVIEGAGFELVAAQCKSEEELIEVAHDADAVICQYARVGEKTINAFTNCRLIARYGIGVDIVDVEAATGRNILVTNIPDYCVDEVADHAMAMLLACIRKLQMYNEASRAGIWRWQAAQPIYRMRGRTMGLLAFGKIARTIAERAKPFGVQLIAYDPYVAEQDFVSYSVTPVSFDELIEQVDYLMIQVPLTPETKGMIGEKELKKMKPASVLINTSRGPLVDNDALYRALKEGWISAAGIDDTVEEPAKKKDWKPDNPLFQLDNIIITPHSAYYSEESIHEARLRASEEVVRVLSGNPPLSPVNRVKLADGSYSRAS